jgi:hypothetical protein
LAVGEIERSAVRGIQASKDLIGGIAAEGLQPLGRLNEDYVLKEVLVRRV